MLVFEKSENDLSGLHGDFGMSDFRSFTNDFLLVVIYAEVSDCFEMII